MGSPCFERTADKGPATFEAAGSGIAANPMVFSLVLRLQTWPPPSDVAGTPGVYIGDQIVALPEPYVFS